MDPTGMLFYAVVCGSLSAAAPLLGSTVTRSFAGAATGVVAALVLPMLQGMMY